MIISVVIPSYNRSHTLKRAIESVLRQTQPADEIIVVDDGSDDDSANLVANYPSIQYLYQPNAGVSAARNKGIRQAQGDWIALLDSDDEWLQTKLELQTEMIQSNQDYRLCHGNELWVRNGQHLNQKKKHTKNGGWIFQQCLALCVISPSASLIKKDLLFEVGLFDTTLAACEDYDMWLKICCREPVLYVEQAILRKYGGHADQLSQKYWGMDRFRIKALQNILSAGKLNCEQKGQAQTMLQHKAALFAKGARKRGRIDDAASYEQIAQSLNV